MFGLAHPGAGLGGKKKSLQQSCEETPNLERQCVCVCVQVSHCLMNHQRPEINPPGWLVSSLDRFHTGFWRPCPRGGCSRCVSVFIATLLERQLTAKQKSAPCPSVCVCVCECCNQTSEDRRTDWRQPCHHPVYHAQPERQLPATLIQRETSRERRIAINLLFGLNGRNPQLQSLDVSMLIDSGGRVLQDVPVLLKILLILHKRRFMAGLLR